MAKAAVKTYTTYPTAVVVAASLKAVESTNGEIVKFDQEVVSESNPLGGTVRVKSTRDTMKDFLDDPESLDLASAQEAIDFVHGAVTMAVFCGKMVSDFTRKVVEKIQNETVTSADIGLLAWFPSVYKMLKKSAELREKTVEHSRSQFIGKVGDKITFNFSVISEKYLQQHDILVVFGNTEDGDLITFFTKHPECTKSGKYTGKIKKHEQSTWHENVNVTMLNYVKRSS